MLDRCNASSNASNVTHQGTKQNGMRGGYYYELSEYLETKAGNVILWRGSRKTNILRVNCFSLLFTFKPQSDIGYFVCMALKYIQDTCEKTKRINSKDGYSTRSTVVTRDSSKILYKLSFVIKK